MANLEWNAVSGSDDSSLNENNKKVLQSKASYLNSECAISISDTPVMLTSSGSSRRSSLSSSSNVSLLSTTSMTNSTEVQSLGQQRWGLLSKFVRSKTLVKSKLNQSKHQINDTLDAKSLLKPSINSDVHTLSSSLKSFGLIDYVPIISQENVDSMPWFLCKWKHEKNERNRTSIKVKLVDNSSFTCQDLAGFDNSGNVRIWPCEELMAYLALFDESVCPHLEGRVVMELGGGMTALAGMMVASQNKYSELYLTDGNEKCVINIELILKQNFCIGSGIEDCDLPIRSNIYVQQLRWQVPSDRRNLDHRMQAVLLADCLFVHHAHNDLLNTLDALLVLDDGGQVFILAPPRDGTMQMFVDLVNSDQRFVIDVHEHFSANFEKLLEENNKQNKATLSIDHSPSSSIDSMFTNGSQSDDYLDTLSPSLSAPSSPIVPINKDANYPYLLVMRRKQCSNAIIENSAG